MDDVAEAFVAIVQHASKTSGDKPLARKVYEHSIDDDWSYAFNVSLENVQHDGQDIAGLTAIMTWRGFPTGAIGIDGGILIGGEQPGETEANLLAALRDAADSFRGAN